MSNLYNKLKEYSVSGIYPFHMPGHKRNTASMPEWNPWEIDMTEVEGTDNLHHAEGILKEAMERAAGLSGADQTYFLVNGSTGGILSAVASVVKPGDTVLVARNCHKSVYHAVFLNQLRAVYIYPEWIEEYHMAGGICPDKVEKILAEHPQIRAVILTSPTYEGIVSDIGRITEAAHRRGIPVIVDEAHGAHFNQAGFPVSAVKRGADIVIQSYHKTLPALTQTGVLHLCGSLVNRQRLEEFLSIYQTSSPSYVLMASIDYAVSFLENGQEAMKAYEKRLLSVRERLAQLTCISVPGRELVGKYAVYDVDNSKIILAAGGKHGDRILNGKRLYEILRLDYGLQCEMAMEGYALAMTSVMDTEEGYERLIRALSEISDLYGRLDDAGRTGTPAAQSVRSDGGIYQENRKEAVLTIAEAGCAAKESVPFWQAAGRISGEYLYLYPPGTPLLVPGERITAELLHRADNLKRIGFELQGLQRETEIQVCIAVDKAGRKI